MPMTTASRIAYHASKPRETANDHRQAMANMRREIFMLEVAREKDRFTMPGILTYSEMKLIPV